MLAAGMIAGVLCCRGFNWGLVAVGKVGGEEHFGIGGPAGWEPVQPFPDMPPLFWNVAH